MRFNLSLDASGDPLGVDSAVEKHLPACRLRVTTCRLAASINPATTRTQPTRVGLRVGPREQWWIEIVKPLAALEREQLSVAAHARAAPGP